jgi:hypothetical protein
MGVSPLFGLVNTTLFSINAPKHKAFYVFTKKYDEDSTRYEPTRAYMYTRVPLMYILGIFFMKMSQ